MPFVSLSILAQSVQRKQISRIYPDCFFEDIVTPLIELMANYFKTTRLNMIQLFNPNYHVLKMFSTNQGDFYFIM
jgi:hypothetical protein